MRKFFLVAALLASLTSSASAGAVVGGIISLGLPHTEQWNDQSYETAIVGGEDGTLDVGDVLFGIFSMESYGVEGGVTGVDRFAVGGLAPIEITGIFAAVVSTKDVVAPVPIVLPGGGFAYSFAPYAGFEAIFGAGAMIAAFEGSGLTKNFTPNPVPTGIATASDGLHLATLGFAGLAGEGWSAVTNTDVFSALTIVSSFAANLNTIISAGFANDLTTSLNISFSRESAFDIGEFTQFQINGNLFAATSPGADDFPIRDSADILFNVESHGVPEPGSFAIFAGLVALVGFAGRRRKV